MVVVRFTSARIIKDQIGTAELASSGFLVNDSGTVVTALHTLGDVPADWSNPLSSIEVHDGQRFFNATLDKYDWVADLAALQIKDWQKSKKHFHKKHIRLASVEEKKNLEEMGNLYGFCFVNGLNESIHSLPVIFGPYLAETNIVNGEISPVAFGAINRVAEVGCSGSPLVGPKGEAYGVVSRTIIHTYVATLEELQNFIKSDQLEITRRLIAVQKNR